MVDIRERMMQIIGGMDTGSLARMLESEGVTVELPRQINPDSSAAAQLLEADPVESFNDIKVSLGKGPGGIFNRSAITKAEREMPVNHPRQAVPKYLEEASPEYLAGDAGGVME